MKIILKKFLRETPIFLTAAMNGSVHLAQTTILIFCVNGSDVSESCVCFNTLLILIFLADCHTASGNLMGIYYLSIKKKKERERERENEDLIFKNH